MEVDIKRGIDFSNRLWQEKLTRRLQTDFLWWQGGGISLLTVIFNIVAVFINILLIFPIFSHKLTPAYSSSALVLVGHFLAGFGLEDQFFLSLTLCALVIAPVSFYFFVRQMVFKHELTAFFATLFFILPTPFFKDGLPLIGAILEGDGAHALVFAFLPITLLSIRNFIVTGEVKFRIISAFICAVVAILSPFAYFNLLIILTILTVAEGFQGLFRVKLKRSLFLISSSFALSFFWYYPNMLTKIVVLEHVKFTLQKLWQVFPLLIPIVPVVGAISFLIFDRREKLKPIFFGIALFITYLTLFNVSKIINTTGIFTAERYLIELSFSLSFLVAVIFGLLVEYVFRKYVLDLKGRRLFYLYIVLTMSIIFFVGSIAFLAIKTKREAITNAIIADQYHQGIGSLERKFNFNDPSTIFATIVSFVALLFILQSFKYPGVLNRVNND